MFKLNNFYSKEGFFLDNDNDDIYDGIKGQIFIKEDAAVTEKIFALNFLARLAYECTAISVDNINFFRSYEEIPEYSIIIEVDNQLNLVNDETEISVENNKLIIRSKSHEALQVNGKYVYGRMPYVWQVGKNEKLLEDIVDVFKKNQMDEVTIDKIILGSKFAGLKNIHITVNSSNMWSSCFEKTVQIFDSVKKFTVIYNGEEIIIENKDFAEKNNSMQNHTNKYKKDKNLDLSDLFSVDGIYHDSEKDLMNNRMEYSISVHENISDIAVKATGNIVTRAAIDCLELKLDFVKLFDEEEQSNIIEIIEDECTEAKLYVNYASNKIVIKGNRDNLLQLSMWLAKQYPYIDFDKTVNIKDLESLLSNVSNKRNHQGQLIYFQKVIDEEKLGKRIVFYTDIPEQENIEAYKNKLSDKFTDYNFDILSVSKEETVWKEEYGPQWEVKTFEDIISNEVYPLLDAGDKVEISGFLSEEAGVRADLANRISKEISNKGAQLEKCNIFSSYKQGFSWITEKVIPELKKLNKVTKIIIKFKPFLPEGITKWTDEDGAVPTTRIDMPHNRDRWFDLPIRYLQELYPVDDILSKELKLDRNNIIFEAHDGLKETYEIVCYRENEEAYRDTEMTRVSEIPYLYEFPELGKVHPSTGWISVTVNGQIIVNKQVKTDLENIWDFYQNIILKKTKDYIIKKENGNISAEKQPFFKELKIEAEISDLDYKLPVRKDLISSLDAFHEDLYFVGLDYFRYLGLKMSGIAAKEPGLIMPVIKKVNGKGPKVTVTLTRGINDVPRIIIDDREFFITEHESKYLKVDSISCLNNNIGLNIKVNNEDFCFMSKYAEYINEDTINDIMCEKNVNIIFENEATKERSTIYHSSSKIISQKKKLNRNKIRTDKLIGYYDYIELMKELKDINHIKSYVASKSYQGRDVYVIELIDEGLNDIVSRSKLINNKPVCLINSRHHANEVSSTNAAFNLIKKLLTDIKYKKYMEKLNIVIIPFENPDGGHIHYELQKDNPEWKLHVARFNSLGKELTDEQFKSDTKHTEALAFTKTWYKWLPDVVTDNHGVPSHEWDQQFSGYVSPYYKGFWIPRALYYAYFWHIANEEYKNNNMGVCKIIQEKLSGLINDDEEISKWNSDWAERFEKYAHKWMPKMFPADYYKNLIFYWIPTDIKKNKKYSSHKYPNITSLDWTTEVSDETATGEYLELCARAHLKACLAVFESVISINNKPEILDYENSETVILNKKRKRPLHIN